MLFQTRGLQCGQRPAHGAQQRQPGSRSVAWTMHAPPNRFTARHTQSTALRGAPLGARQRTPGPHTLRLQAVAAADKSKSSDRPVKPAYNKYRSRTDMERSYLRQWQEVTARGAEGQTRMTLFSALGYLPRWAKYMLVPDFLRFLWWLVWVRVCAVAHVIHRAAVLQGAKIDALLEERQSGHRTFSRAVVLRRYHHRMGLWDNVVYRWQLLRGSAVGSTSEATLEPQTA